MPFDPKVFSDKLAKLDVTQQKIETLSSWCQFYRKEARKVVHVWEQELPRAPPPRQLAMAYLANDILQNRYASRGHLLLWHLMLRMCHASPFRDSGLHAQVPNCF